MSRIDVHAKWVSPRVLEIMAETGVLPPPSKDHEIEKDGGKIIRDKSGKPTGMTHLFAVQPQVLLTSDSGIFMDKAMNLIPSPEGSDSQMQDAFDQTAKLALRYGLTSIHDAATDAKSIAFYRRYASSLAFRLSLSDKRAMRYRIAEEGNLPLRMYLMGYSTSVEYWGNDTTTFPKMHNYGKHGRLNFRAVKMFTDGEF